MRKKIIALVLTVSAVIILVGGLFAFYSFPRASARASYPLNLSGISGQAILDGVPMGITPNHGQVVQIQIFVTSQHAGGSTMVLSETMDARAARSVTYSRYTIGQTILLHRTYQDGYSEITNSSILLTQQMIEHGIRGFLETGPLPQFFEITVQQWVSVQGIQGPQGVQGPQGIYTYDLAWLNVAIPSVALIVSAMVLIRGFSRIPKEADK